MFLCSICNRGPSVQTSSYQGNQSDSKFVSVDITYEEQLGSDVVGKVRKAIEMFPADAIQSFSKQGWKIAVLSDIDSEENPDNGMVTTVGLTNYDTKTIQVSPTSSDFSVDDSEDLLTIRMVHEFSHFADVFYGNVTDSDKWKKLYAEYKDEYVEFEFYGIDKNMENQFDIGYATSNRYEFFACSMKDFYCHQDYLREHYPNLYVYFVNLVSQSSL